MIRQRRVVLQIHLLFQAVLLFTVSSLFVVILWRGEPFAESIPPNGTLDRLENTDVRDSSLEIDIRSPAIRSLNITILVVIYDESKMEEYSFALDTVRCYSLMHKYSLLIVFGNDYKQCRQRDPMFRRHCIVAVILETTEWILYIDADIGVVNPTRLIEEYVDTRYDITFYDRFCSWEVAMGSYIVKNTPFARSFLRNFADYETKLPDSFHGSDNGAIHAYILETLTTDYRRDAQVCYSIWQRSSGFNDLFLFEACIRTFLGSRRDFDKVRIVRKGTGWVRDIWLTNSQWSSERDFMLHGMKESDRSAIPKGLYPRLRSLFASRFTWYPPLTKHLDLQECSTGHVKWKYDPRLLVSHRIIERHLRWLATQVEQYRWRLLAKVKKYL